ncbi:hypothetical protein N7495_003224 [Penicillium taxi]|uniref:uncharacterized protein n=1 Tax=Penicillium taxi TaxID=168475 RepID=UPI002544EC87|nr:uncharacterized protein N7495_003224 [Penicillium taxi]KAJ5902696.1 hypothetical protein N7495_003224 [Penicillium taxi]
MALAYIHVISILQLIIFLPSFFISLFLVIRHGLRTNSGFLFLTTFALARIIGACCELATINNSSTGLWTAAAICSAIGLSPLMLACSGMLSRVNESIRENVGRFALPDQTFIFYRIFNIAALSVTIAGISASMSVEGLQNPDTKAKVGMILYIVAFALLCLLLAIILLRCSSIPKGEHRAVLAVAISMPFIFVRLIYVVLIWFLHDHTFNMIDGNNTVKLVMSVLEEFAVIIAFLGIGLTLQVRRQSSIIPKDDVSDQTGVEELPLPHHQA